MKFEHFHSDEPVTIHLTLYTGNNQEAEYYLMLFPDNDKNICKSIKLTKEQFDDIKDTLVLKLQSTYNYD